MYPHTIPPPLHLHNHNDIDCRMPSLTLNSAQIMSSASDSTNKRKRDDVVGDDTSSSPDTAVVEVNAGGSSANQQLITDVSMASQQISFMMSKMMSEMKAEMKAEMKVELGRMQQEMDFRLAWIESLESKAFHMQREIDHMKKRERRARDDNEKESQAQRLAARNNAHDSVASAAANIANHVTHAANTHNITAPDSTNEKRGKKRGNFNCE